MGCGPTVEGDGGSLDEHAGSQLGLAEQESKAFRGPILAYGRGGSCLGRVRASTPSDRTGKHLRLTNDGGQNPQCRPRRKSGRATCQVSLETTRQPLPRARGLASATGMHSAP